MKLYLRLLVLCLAALLSMSVLIGCNNDNDTDLIYEDEDDYDDVDEYFPDVSKKDYDEELYLYVYSASNPKEYYILDESDGSPMDESVYARQERVSKYLGIEVVDVEAPSGSNYLTYIEVFKSAVNNKDGTVDIMLSHVNGGVASLISENFLRDLSEMDGLDLEADYWNMDFMETLELNGRLFLGFSDYNILYTHIIAFNKDMYSKYEASIPKTPYNLVRDKEWTLDEMISLASLVSQDMTGDGKTLDDIYGITANAWVSFCGFLQASNINMMEMDDSGTYKVAINSSKNYARAEGLISKIKDMSKSNYAYIEYGYNGGAPTMTTGRTLLSVASTYDLPRWLDYDVDFGVLPYPMYDINQASVGYRSLQWGGYICVPIYVKNEAKIAESLELYAYYSENVKITYYEKLLGKQVADMPDDADMLEIIWQSVCTDVGQTFANTMVGDNTGVCYTVSEVANPNSTYGGLASFIATKEKNVNNAFQKFIDGIN